MTLEFSKEFVDKFSSGHTPQIKNGKLYQVAHNANLLSELLISNKISYLKYGNKELTIKRKDIIDSETTSNIGRFYFTNWTIFIGYRDKLEFNGKKYLFKRLRPDVRYSLFKRSTWNQFKFQLQFENEIITYSFKIDLPSFTMGNQLPEKPFNGAIENINSDIPTMTLGLYLVERALENAGLETE